MKRWTAFFLGAILFAPGAGAAADRQSNGAPVPAASANLDDEARSHILDEAGKLFGGGRAQFNNLLGSGISAPKGEPKAE